MAAFDSRRLIVGNLLHNNTRERIVVPEFQRGYEWGEKEVKEFWDDLVSFHKERGNAGAASLYFLGPVVLADQKDPHELLDGQQRLATVTMLLSAIRDIARTVQNQNATDFANDTQRQFIEKNGQYALELGDTDKDFFREYVQVEGATKPKPKQRTHRNIVRAHEALTKFLKDFIGASATPDATITVLRAIRQIIQSDLAVAAISVQSDNDAFRIFQTLNDRGLSLSAPDLLLVYLMRKAPPEPAHDRKEIRRKWTEMIDELELMDVEDYIRAWWVSKHGDVKKTDLFTVISGSISENGTTSIAFTNECYNECDSYIQIVNYEIESAPETNSHLRNLISDLKSDASIPLLLSAIGKFNADNFNKLCKFLLVFSVRYAVLGGLDRSGLENLFFRLARETRAAMDGPDADQNSHLRYLKNQLEGNSPTDAQIDSRSEKVELTDTQARYILRKIGNFIQAENNEIEISKATIEHIYPKRPEENQWGGAENQQKLDGFIQNIGNLTLIASKTNSKKCKNLEYPDKRPIYQSETHIKMTQNIATHYTGNWDDVTIKERAKHLVDKAKAIWHFDHCSKV